MKIPCRCRAILLTREGREGAPPADSTARSGRSALQGGVVALGLYDDEALAKVKKNYMQVARLRVRRLRIGKGEGS